MAGTLTINGMSAGLVSGQKVIGPVTMTGSATIGGISDASLASGDNPFVVPVGASAVAIFLGQASSVTVSMRTNLNVSDEGFPIGGSGFAVVPLESGVTEMILNSSGSLPGIELSFI